VSELVLFTDDLLSKWGFNDGDLPDELDDWLKARGERIGSWHPVLCAVVRECLLPALDQRLEVQEIETIHNPIRATVVDGVEVPEGVHYGRMTSPFRLTPARVSVPFETVLAAARRVEAL